MFVRHDAVRKPLQPPYDGPFKVLQRADKFFILDINGKQDTVSLDHLKPAFLDPSILESLPTTPSVADRVCKAQHPAIVPPQQASSTAPPAVTTRSGRRVKPPQRFRT